MSDSPYCKIVFVRSFFSNGTVLRGTGVILGPDLILTAAHVVYRDDYGGWASYCRVYSEVSGERSNNDDHDGQSVKMIISASWTEEVLNYPESDWAYMIVDNDIGYEQGWMGFGYSPTYFDNYTISGYPGQAPNSSEYNCYDMYTDSGSISYNSDETMFYYTIDTGRCQSGAPLYTPTQIVYGVHTGVLNANTNRAVRIQRFLFDYLKANKEEGIERWSDS